MSELLTELRAEVIRRAVAWNTENSRPFPKNHGSGLADAEYRLGFAVEALVSRSAYEGVNPDA